MKLSIEKTLKSLPLILTSTCLFSLSSQGQQAVTGIITDYNSFWKSSSTSINAIKPSNSHNLLAFTYNNHQYSTGVNDLSLSAHGETFSSGDFWSLPVDSYSGAITTNTKVGVGELYDGVHNGAGIIPPANNLPQYLTDGIKGLNIGTCVANIPAGTLFFFISNIVPASIGDGIPDILVTQVADPSGSTDRYSLVDNAGNLVGHSMDIVFTNIAPVANWTADFYEAASNPMNLTTGFTNTDRPMRLWAADLSDFGITAANYQQVSKFRINISGNSDVAFVAYNNRTFSLNVALPVTLSSFTAKAENGKGMLNWQTNTEKEAKNFLIEKSLDNVSFQSIATVAAKGTSSELTQYAFTDINLATGKSYYRLKMVDIDGQFTYSKTVMVQQSSKGSIALSIYPNPASSNITVTHPAAAKQQIRIFNMSGMPMASLDTKVGDTQTSIDISAYAKGSYVVRMQGAGEISSQHFVVR